MAPATHVSRLGFGDWIIGPDSGRVTSNPEVIHNEHENLCPLGSITVPESSLQRQSWLRVPLNVDQLPLNGTLTQVGFATRPLANLPGHFGREFCVGRASHLLQDPQDLAVRKHIDEGRLSQGNAERCLQGVIEYRIPRIVGKIGDHDGVLLSQTIASLIRTRIKPARDK